MWRVVNPLIRIVHARGAIHNEVGPTRCRGGIFVQAHRQSKKQAHRSFFGGFGWVGSGQVGPALIPDGQHQSDLTSILIKLFFSADLAY